MAFKQNCPDVNLRGSEWAHVEEWLAEELHETYKRLANVNATEVETQQLRGRASLLVQMLEFRNLPVFKSPA